MVQTSPLAPACRDRASPTAGSFALRGIPASADRCPRRTPGKRRYVLMTATRRDQRHAGLADRCSRRTGIRRRRRSFEKFIVGGNRPGSSGNRWPRRQWRGAVEQRERCERGIPIDPIAEKMACNRHHRPHRPRSFRRSSPSSPFAVCDHIGCAGGLDVGQPRGAEFRSVASSLGALRPGMSATSIPAARRPAELMMKRLRRREAGPGARDPSLE